MSARPRLRPALHTLLATAALGVPLSGAATAQAIPLAPDDQPPQTIATAPVLQPRPTWHLPVASYEITGTFGASSSLWSSTHTGLDFAAAEGTEIHAVTGGVVVSVGYDGAYGNKTVVRLSDGSHVWFCHQSETRVEPGTRVEAGEVIGTVGSTGNVTGPHLHLEFRTNGQPQDPYTVLTEHGLQP